MSTISIPQFVTARTPEGLQEEIIRFQASNQLIVDVTNIQFVKGKWYAWFKVPLSRLRETNGG